MKDEKLVRYCKIWTTVTIKGKPTEFSTMVKFECTQETWAGELQLAMQKFEKEVATEASKHYPEKPFLLCYWGFRQEAFNNMWRNMGMTEEDYNTFLATR